MRPIHVEPLQTPSIAAFVSHDVIGIEADEPVARALARMRDRRVHELVVQERGHAVGWISYDSLIRRTGVGPATKVRHVMEPRVHLPPAATVASAARFMVENGVHAVLVEGREASGVLSRTDLLRAALDAATLAPTPVARLMTEELTTIDRSDSLDRAASMLRKQDVRQLIVLDAGGRVVGVLGREHVLPFLLGPDLASSASRARPHLIGQATKTKPRRLEAGGVAEEPLLIGADTSVGEALPRILAAARTCAVVVDAGGFPLGILSRGDVLRGLAALEDGPGPLIEVEGLRHAADPALLDRIHHEAARALEKLAPEYRIQRLSLHFKLHKDKRTGTRVKYAVAAHLTTERGALVASAWAWDPVPAAVQALKDLERRGQEHKTRRLARRRGRHLAAAPAPEA